MGEIGNNEINSVQPDKPEKIQPDVVKKPTLRQRLSGLFKRNKTKEASSNHSAESPIQIPVDSGYQKLMNSFDNEKPVYDSPIAGHKYTGGQVQKMFENLFPDLVQRLSGTSSSTASIEQLSQVQDGDVVVIYDTLGRLQTVLEGKLPRTNKAASPDFLKVSQINVIRSLLRQQVETLKKESLQKRLKDAIKADESVQEPSLVNPLVDNDLAEVSAKLNSPDPLLDQEKKEE